MNLERIGSLALLCFASACMVSAEDDYLEERDYQRCSTTAWVSPTIALKAREEPSTKANVLGSIFPESNYVFLRNVEGEAYECGSELCYSWSEIEYEDMHAFAAAFYLDYHCSTQSD